MFRSGGPVIITILDHNNHDSKCMYIVSIVSIVSIAVCTRSSQKKKERNLKPHAARFRSRFGSRSSTRYLRIPCRPSRRFNDHESEEATLPGSLSGL